jgi:hypothetical protein
VSGVLTGQTEGLREDDLLLNELVDDGGGTLVNRSCATTTWDESLEFDFGLVAPRDAYSVEFYLLGSSYHLTGNDFTLCDTDVYVEVELGGVAG